MPIEFYCPGCGKLMRTPDETAGRKGRCPNCQIKVAIPLSSIKTNDSGLRQSTIDEVAVPRREPIPTGKIQFKCGSCERSLTVPAANAGKKGKCPHCGAVMSIPRKTKGPAAKAPDSEAAARWKGTPKQQAAPASGKIEFHCSSCQKVVRVGAAAAGQMGQCPICKSVIKIPMQATTSTSGLTPVGGLQPMDSAALTPLDNSGLTPLDNSGLTPLDNSGLTPLDSGLAPLDNSGLAPLDNSGLAPLDNSGLAPLDNSGLTPLDNSGLAPLDSGLTPLGNSGQAVPSGGVTDPLGVSGMSSFAGQPNNLYSIPANRHQHKASRAKKYSNLEIAAGVMAIYHGGSAVYRVVTTLIAMVRLSALIGPRAFFSINMIFFLVGAAISAGILVGGISVFARNKSGVQVGVIASFGYFALLAFGFIWSMVSVVRLIGSDVGLLGMRMLWRIIPRIALDAVGPGLLIFLGSRED